MNETPKAAPAPAQVATGPGADAQAVQAQVAAIWERFLGVQKPKGSDNFFDLGGHSLLAVQVHRAIREELGAVKLSITDIFRLPVLSDLGKKVAELAGPVVPKAVRAQTRAVAPDPVKVAQMPEQTAATRASARSDAMARRREMRSRRRA